ncbi:hypothetical protein Tcan_09489 [Toxocara canis]|uniref:Uncharacterized protein n=1 Tax=Toxocara canis TaxID=6265 RepID=A0A0B2USJ5_TOXCA|nr:hypothetical protein Tcan_09489 [Toxocara canis]
MLMNGLNDSLAVVISQLSSRKEALQLAAASAAANWSLLLLRHSESSTADESSLRRDMTKTLVKVAKEADVVGTVNRVKDALVAECGKAIARDIVGMAYADGETQVCVGMPMSVLGTDLFFGVEK